MMKKTFVLFLAAVIVCSLIACGNQTDDTNAGGNASTPAGGGCLGYTLSKDGTYYEARAPRDDNGNTVSITVPGTHEGLPVGIPKHAFLALTNLESVVIEDAVVVESQAFLNCPKLKSITIAGQVDIPARCIDSLIELESIVFGAGIKALSANCVNDCQMLKTVVIGDDCVSIGDNAFADLEALESVTLGKNLELIGKQAFANTTSLRSIEFPTEKTLIIEDEAFSHSGLEELHIPANLVLGSFVFKFLAWVGSEESGYSQCKGAWFYAELPTKDNLGSNSIGYTWDRTANDDAELGNFMIYVPSGCRDAYEKVMRYECDEAWNRCVLEQGRLTTFDPN